MSSSGLIYAVIVGAWAAYLVPMWLRRQDELNEARPTERFSTAIRLLSGRAAMERKISRQLEETQPLTVSTSTVAPASGHPDATDMSDADTEYGSDAGFGTDGEGDDGGADDFFVPAAARRTPAAPSAHAGGPSPAAASRSRAALLARRRRMVVILFAAFTAGMVGAAVGGVALLWIPAIPAVLFSLYIAQMRRQEHRRYEVKLDRRRAVEAAQRVRQQAAARREAATAAMAAMPAAEADHGPVPTTSGAGTPGAGSEAGTSSAGASRRMPSERVERAERSEHARRAARDERVEPWADHDAPERGGVAGSTAARLDDGWEPVPVPLPTYVTAPVAPRATLGLDLSAPDTYSSARGRQPGHPGQAADAGQGRQAQHPAQAPAAPPRRPAPKQATPLFDQYAEDTPRAANE